MIGEGDRRYRAKFGSRFKFFLSEEKLKCSVFDRFNYSEDHMEIGDFRKQPCRFLPADAIPFWTLLVMVNKLGSSSTY